VAPVVAEERRRGDVCDSVGYVRPQTRGRQ
jgi:hypothetical protein